MEKMIIRAAVVQAAPRLFDKASAFEKIAKQTEEAAAQGAQLVVFPEAFVSGYPRGMSFGARVGSRTPGGRRDWERHWASAIEVPGAEADLLGRIAKKSGVVLAVGVIERERDFARATLYNTLVYFGPDGALLGKHRKLVPTGSERLLWGQGDGSTLTVVETPFGRIGGLICWENYMPLARMALYGKGVDLWIAPTADSRDSWQATIRHIACEGRCFVLSANQYATKSGYPAELDGYGDMADDDEVLCRGGSAIVGPLGDYVREPLYGEEGLLVADLDLGETVRGRYDFDVTGHYARPDIFKLQVNERANALVVYGEGDGSL